MDAFLLRLAASTACVLTLSLAGLPAAALGPSGSLEPVGGFPGVSGNTGDDATLAALYALSNLPVYPDAGRPIYYFSCDAGGDYPLGQPWPTHDGLTPATAFDQWSSAAAVYDDAGVTFRFDAGDACFRFAGTDQLDATVTQPPGSKDVILRIDSSRIGQYATITQDSAGSVGLIHLFGAVDDLNTTGGRVVVQDIHCASFTTSCFVVDNGIDMLGLHLKNTAADGARESIGRAVMDGNFVCLNCEPTSYDDSAIDVSEAGSQTYIGTATITMSTPAAGFTAVALVRAGNGFAPGDPNSGTTASLTVVGHSLLIPASATGLRSSLQLAPLDTDGTYTSRVAVARVLLAGGSASKGSCFRWKESGTKTVQFSIFQSTLMNCDIVLSGSDATYTTPIGATSYKRIKWSILDGGTGLTSLLMQDYGGAIEAGTWDATDNIVNERGGALPFFMRYRRPAPATAIEASSTVVQFRADVDADPAVIDPAMDGAFAWNITANSIQQVADADSNVGSACQPDKACASPPADQTYTVPLYAPIWAEALGTTTDLANLTLSVRHYGAKPVPGGCGLGPELTVLLAALRWLHARTRTRSSTARDGQDGRLEGGGDPPMG